MSLFVPEYVLEAGSGNVDGGVLFELTPYKIAVCQLVQVFAPPAQPTIPFPFHSTAQHNRLGLFLFSLIRSSDDFLEPSLEVLLDKLRVLDNLLNSWLCEHLVDNLIGISSPEDLFNFFDKLRGVTTPLERVNVEEDQILLDQNSQLGLFVRCSLLAFNSMTFEGTCHLLGNLNIYCSAASSSYDFFEEDHNNCSSIDNILDEDKDLGTSSYDRSCHTYEVDGHASTSSLSHLPVLEPFHHFFEESKSKEDNACTLRSRWQIEAYLAQQADALEKDPSCLPMNSFNATLTKLQNLAPEFLWRVHFSKYLNSLYHRDYSSSLLSLHRYFDYSAGTDCRFSGSSGTSSNIIVGRYETALLCLGSLHGYFCHSKKALEAFTDAVRISQMNNDDSCLAYTLTAVANILDEIGTSSTAGVIDSPDSLGSSIGFCTPSSTQQQLLVLLMRSLYRAKSLGLTNLLSFNYLSLAKFHLKHIQRPLVSFGPDDFTNLKTSPVDVCKNLRLASRILIDIGSEDMTLANDSGSFSTSWLKNLSSAAGQQCSGSLLPYKRLASNDYDSFCIHAQPNPVPGYVLQLAGSTHLQRATVWEYYGSAPMVRMSALAYAICFADAASSAELSLSYVKLIQYLAVSKGYAEAFSALKVAKEKLPISNSRLQLLEMQLLHERALHRGHLKVAQQVCDEFKALASVAGGADMDLKTESGLRLARTLLSANQFSQAAALAHSLFCSCYKFNMQLENASILLLLAEIYKKSGNSVCGLQYALASLSFCKSFNLDLLEASAKLTIAEIWLSLGSTHATRASSLLHQTLPIILGHGGLELCARAHIAAAKCLLSRTHFAASEDAAAVLDHLDQAVVDLEDLEFHELIAEAYYLKAMVYNHLGQMDQREEAAAAFRDNILALENPQDEAALLVF